MAYAQYYCGLGEGRYKELGLGSGDFNSHFPMLDRYRAMLAEWKRSADPARLMSDDIVRITSAG